MTTKKTILIIAGIIIGMLLIIAGGVYGDSQNFSQPVTLSEKTVSIEGKQGKCGDGICDVKEKANPNLCPEDCKPTQNIPYYTLVIHLDPVADWNERYLSQTPDYYERAKEMVEYANQYNIKLSLGIGHALAEYIAESPERMEEVKQWTLDGHELGIHHHSIYKPKGPNAWDGFTSVPDEIARRTRIELNGVAEPYPETRTFEEYMKVFHKFEDEFGIEIKSGIAHDQANKKVSMPNELIYSTGSGFTNNGDKIEFVPNDREITKAINEFIVTATVNGIERKWISHYFIGNSESRRKLAEETFDSLDSDIVFSAVCHNIEGEINNYKRFLDFLHNRDPEASKSRTVTQVMESGIFSEREIDLPCENLNGTVCTSISHQSDKGCTGEWLIKDGDYKCCSEYCTHSQENIPSYFIAIHNEPFGANERNYKVLKDLIERANQYNMKLTLMFTPAWVDFILNNPLKKVELENWKTQGHEISAHHHSVHHPGNWDGYSDYTFEQAVQIREEEGLSKPRFTCRQGTLDDFMDKINKLGPNIISGCLNDEVDKKALPKDIIYDTCSGYENFGTPGNYSSVLHGESFKNEFISVGTVEGIERKWLTHGQILTETDLKEAENQFNSMDKHTVYGGVVHSKPWEVPYMLQFMDFLHEKDSTGAKSMTLTEIIESGILPEEKINVDNYSYNDSPFGILGLDVKKLKLKPL